MDPKEPTTTGKCCPDTIVNTLHKHGKYPSQCTFYPTSRTRKYQIKIFKSGILFSKMLCRVYSGLEPEFHVQQTAGLDAQNTAEHHSWSDAGYPLPRNLFHRWPEHTLLRPNLKVAEACNRSATTLDSTTSSPANRYSLNLIKIQINSTEHFKRESMISSFCSTSSAYWPNYILRRLTPLRIWTFCKGWFL